MRPLVLICSGCKKAKKFGEWVEQNRSLRQAIADKLVMVEYRTCPTCQPGASNRLLPVED